MEALLAGDFTQSAASAETPFASEFITLSRQEHIQLVWEGRHWKRLHQGAVERIAQLEAEYRERLRSQLDSAERREQALQRELTYARGRIRDLEQRLFGRKSERQWVIDAQHPHSRASVRGRGQQRGAPGHGRRLASGLPIREEIVEITSPCCPKCGKGLTVFPGTDDSEVLEIEVRAYRRVIRRQRYRPTCACGQLPGIVTAPAPTRLIERGKLGISVWTDALLDKFLYGRASTRWIQQLADQGVKLSAGTLGGGLQGIAPLFQPLYQALLPRLREEPHWHADETRWEVFVERDDKAGHRWYLWVFQSCSVVYYVLDPSRSAAVPAVVLEGVENGLISCDRHGAYKKFSRLHPGIVLAFCWAHQRRDFLTLANEHPTLTAWAMRWVDRIGELFKLYEQRTQAAPDSAAYRTLDRCLRSCLRTMARERHRALTEPQLPEPAVKRLESMQRHWRGLREFVRHSAVPPDNNAAERALRMAVVGRKNFYGSGSEWSGELAAMMFSLLMTMKRWQINPRTWLRDYLNACAAAGNRAPPDLKPYLPWGMDPARLAQMRRAPCENAHTLARRRVDTS
ncbi:IS66 family transposase [Methyloceanibacter sp.]|uniref:IS66 family transposase n=1 Tax=Methyloceanibacter sp. TaxID=1965321 RepID=UPI003D6D8FD0